jgi:hypothetical protein
VWISRGDLWTGARLLRALPSFLRHPVSSEEARSVLRRRLEHRQGDFLDVARRLVYGQPDSPYRALLARAGCEYGDLARLVAADGVEGALGTLFRAGVYLTVEEFKGRRALVRGGTVVPFEPAQLCNPRSVVHVVASSGGSRGPGTTVPIDLASARDQAVNRRLALEARGALGWRHAVWGRPGASELVIVLRFAACGATPERWFSQLDPGGSGLHPRYRWGDRVLRWGSLGSGVRLPLPRHVPIDAPGPIIDWLTGVLRAGATPHLKTFASAAVRLCQIAHASRVDLTGAHFTTVGEPLTPARDAEIRRTGARHAPEYGATESGQIAEWCLAPQAVDDVHLMHDLHAVIQPGPDPGSGSGPSSGSVARLPDTALLLTSLRPTAPLILLNVSLGDQAEMARGSCGCAMERSGWPTRLQRIRSFEKLTSEGMAVLDVDVLRVLDEVLPERFGGTAASYQLVEDESQAGAARLRLLVDPAVGPVDAAAVADAFLEGVAAVSESQRMVALLWRQAGVLSVERRPPLVTPGGKILHVHRHALAPAGGEVEPSRA